MDNDSGLTRLAHLVPSLLVDYEFPTDPEAAAEAQRRATYSSLWAAIARGEVPSVRIGTAVFLTDAARDLVARKIGLQPRPRTTIAA